MRKLITLSIIVISIIQVTAQNKIKTHPYDADNIKQDTSRMVVEVVKYEYEYYDPEPWEIFVGSGIGVSQTSLKIAEFDKTVNNVGFSFVLQLKKGNFMVQTGAQYQKIAIEIPVTKTIESQIENTVIETVVVDTFYSYNDGNIIETIVTKEVDTIVYETIEEEVTTNKNRDCSIYKFPLQLGYTYPLKKFRLSANVGAAVNFFTSDSKNNLKEYLSGADQRFFTYELGIGAGYNLSDKFFVDCGLNMSSKTNSKSYTYSANSFDIRFFYKLF